eukprot:5005693-Amphidinium_carterae.1
MIFKTSGPASKPGSPAPNMPGQPAGNTKPGQPAGGNNKPGGPANDEQEQPTKSGPNVSNGQSALLTEQILRKQIKAAKHNPVLMKRFEAALKKLSTDKQQGSESKTYGCQPHEVVSDCKGMVKVVQALQTGGRKPKGRNRDLEQRALSALLFGQKIRWVKAHLNQSDVESGRITVDDFQGNQQ